jgi:hypothetical protein
MAMADYLSGGNVDAFVALKRHGQRLGMANSVFMNPNGLPAEASSPRPGTCSSWPAPTGAVPQGAHHPFHAVFHP